MWEWARFWPRLSSGRSVACYASAAQQRDAAPEALTRRLRDQGPPESFEIEAELEGTQARLRRARERAAALRRDEQQVLGLLEALDREMDKQERFPVSALEDEYRERLSAGRIEQA